MNNNEPATSDKCLIARTHRSVRGFYCLLASAMYRDITACGKRNCDSFY